MIQNFLAATDYYLANRIWLPWVVVAWLALSVLTVLSYRNSPLSFIQKSVGIGLRLTGAGLLLGCLLEPMVGYEVAKQQANSFAILLDNSQSASAVWGVKADESGETTQGHWIVKNLQDDAPWLQSLDKNFRVQLYSFGSDLESVDSYEAVSRDASESAVIRSLQSLRERLPSSLPSANSSIAATDGSPLAGVVLISDGQATDRERLDKLESFPVPIYPVVLNAQGAKPDIAILGVNSSVSDFETSPVVIDCTIGQRGFNDQEVAVELTRLNGELVEQKTVRLKPSGQPTRVEFRFRPKEFGVHGYLIQVHSNFGADGKPAAVHREVTLHNNKRHQVVERKRGPHRVLYVSGRPNWEYKFLSRAIHEDEEIELDALVRIARKEARFSFRGSGTDGSNSLFSGFDDISEDEKEQHDEPVFVRIDSAANKSPMSGQPTKKFPADLKDLFQYKAIVLDDMDAEVLTREQQMMLQQFVRFRGGGLLVLGGTESMRGSDFNTSPLSPVIPIYGERAIGLRESDGPQFIHPSDPRFSGSLDSFVGDGADDGPSSRSFATDINHVRVAELRLNLSREGWLQPFMRLADSESGERTRLQKAPTIQVWNKIAGIKPGAQVLASGEIVNDESAGDFDGLDTKDKAAGEPSIPLLVTQRFGRGRSVAFLAGDWWRWAMNRSGDESPMLYQAWRQIVRWTMTDVPEFVEFTNAAVEEANHARKLQLVLRNHLFEPIEDATIEIVVTNPKGEKQTIQADLSSDMTGRYEAIVLCQAEGYYSATAHCVSSREEQEWNLETGWAYEPLLDEFRGIGEDVDFLSAIAEKSGGRVIAWDELPRFANELLRSDVPIKETIVFPLWHQAWVLLLAVTCLCFEWGWRRRYGMA